MSVRKPKPRKATLSADALEDLRSARLLYDLAVAWNVLDLLLAIARAVPRWSLPKPGGSWHDREGDPGPVAGATSGTTNSSPAATTKCRSSSPR